MIEKTSVIIAIMLVIVSMYELITRQCVVALICVFLQLLTSFRGKQNGN